MRRRFTTLCLVFLCTVATACKVLPRSLGSTPIFAGCELPMLVDEHEASAACETTSFGAPGRIYPSPKEDRTASCALRFPSASGDPDELCPAGELLALELNGALVVIEGQRGGENAGVFVHTFTARGAEPVRSFEYASTHFVPEADGHSVPLEYDVKDGFNLTGPPMQSYGAGARFIDRGAVVDLDGNAFHVKAKFWASSWYPLAAWTVVPTEGDGSRYEYFIGQGAGDADARRLTAEGDTVFTFTDTNEGRASFKYDAVAVAAEGDIALVGTVSGWYGDLEEFGTVLILDGETGTLESRLRTPEYSQRPAVRFLEGGRVFLLGLTTTSFVKTWEGDTVVSSARALPGPLAFIMDATTGCPIMLHEHGGPYVDDSQYMQSLLSLDALYVFGVKPGNRSADAELRLADYEGHLCQSLELPDDGAASALTQIIQIAGEDFIATDGTDIWHIPNTH